MDISTIASMDRSTATFKARSEACMETQRAQHLGVTMLFTAEVGVLRSFLG